MEKLKRFLTLLDKTADKIVYFIGGTGLVVCTGMCCANIFMWWFMGRRIAVNDEIALSGLVWATYIGMGLLFKNKAHCTMDFVVDALPPKAKTFVRIITDIAIVVIACITVYFSTTKYNKPIQHLDLNKKQHQIACFVFQNPIFLQKHKYV